MSITWNTGLAAERARARAQRDAAQFNLKLKEKKRPRPKAEPPANKKLIKKLHDKWCRANGYKLQAASSKRQASSTTKKTQS